MRAEWTVCACALTEGSSYYCISVEELMADAT